MFSTPAGTGFPVILYRASFRFAKGRRKNRESKGFQKIVVAQRNTMDIRLLGRKTVKNSEKIVELKAGEPRKLLQGLRRAFVCGYRPSELAVQGSMRAELVCSKTALRCTIGRRKGQRRTRTI